MYLRACNEVMAWPRGKRLGLILPPVNGLLTTFVFALWPWRSKNSY